jgi:hypothetical protein
MAEIQQPRIAAADDDAKTRRHDNVPAEHPPCSTSEGFMVGHAPLSEDVRRAFEESWAEHEASYHYLGER